MNMEQALVANQKKIKELTDGMALWLNTPAANDPKVRARVQELHDRTIFRLQELELKGQAVKIENMQTVIGLLKGDIKP